ncbi:hypothetical protein SELMODRAFT_403453 [Selaginella moellendorffii]|uniref:Pentacotripeptide-repeat region of PRORP domain-containing protein n=2 Tax=Selaginella moellendorffii TaxID=88036 RepID=D8QRG5_SELML|nr:hypothetical protein SELMODRAFT_411897 [Selaginella moellendorffii]EFJ36773.1 hypothetical protein SELMODRAFT_403453 [Selaginella moellendorffii]
MNLGGVLADEITFTGVLTACNHLGLLAECWEFVLSMSADYHLAPAMEHYCSVVDILGRSGQLKNAEEIIRQEEEEQGSSSGAAAWRALLAASKMQKDGARAIRSARSVIRLDGGKSLPFIVSVGL